MQLTGQHIISAHHVSGNNPTFRASNPVTNEFLPGDFVEGDAADVAIAADIAANAFVVFRQTSGIQRCGLLETIVAELTVLKDSLLQRANLETGLPPDRLEGEFMRTVNQLKMFARLVKDENYRLTCREAAMPERLPVPMPDLRRTEIPVGPVAVFGASNFPLAFSVAGGDTASALAVGCPVVVKGHPAHPGSSELAARAIQQAVQKVDLPEGVFSMIQGTGHEVGAALVQHAQMKAVAFTGSHSGGRALFDLATSRPEPIPVFAEMGSVNPVFILPQALHDNCQDLAGKYAASVTLGVGQFCTNPGLLFMVQGDDCDDFLHHLHHHFNSMESLPMLHSGIKQNFTSKLQQTRAIPGVRYLGGDDDTADPSCFVSPSLLLISAADFLQEPKIAEEIFGPAAVIVQCESVEQLLLLAESLSGQLSATVHAALDEEDYCRKLFSILENKAGRLLLNDFPTGVEVCAAMNHGGPYPATTDSHFTSVGTEAIRRFLRPVCYQNFSNRLLPAELRDSGK